MAAQLTPVLKQRFFDLNGLPLDHGKLFSYIAGTSTPLATYTDQTGLTANPNPVVLDSSGYANIWMAQSAYKFVLKDSNDVIQFTVDNVQSISQQLTSDTEYMITDGQSATQLTQDQWNGIANTSVLYYFECIRGTTVVCNGRFVFQYINGVWRIVLDGYNGEDSGLTFTVVQISTLGALYVAADSGAGNGTLKLKKLAYAA